MAKRKDLWTLPKKTDKMAAAELLHIMYIFRLHGYDVSLDIEENQVNLRLRYVGSDGDSIAYHDVDIYSPDKTWPETLHMLVGMLNARVPVYKALEENTPS